jgi:DNA-binding response OmpR family regulator
MPNPLVLLIEDDRRLRDTIFDLLELLDIDCMIADEEMTTRANLVTLKPDLILLDIPLRVRSALPILTDVRLDFRLRDTKLVLIAVDECADAPEFRLADTVLIKPFAIGDLETALRSLLGHNRTPDIRSRGADLAMQASSVQG